MQSTLSMPPSLLPPLQEAAHDAQAGPGAQLEGAQGSCLGPGAQLRGGAGLLMDAMRS